MPSDHDAFVGEYIFYCIQLDRRGFLEAFADIMNENEIDIATGTLFVMFDIAYDI